MQALSLIVLFALALPAMGTDPLTLTLGSTAYVLTSSQVTVAAASIAALALTKELLILADLGAFRGKGKRDVNAVSNTPLDFSAFFETIAKSDTDNCGKLLVCHSIAKTGSLNAEEKAITKLFDNLEVINPNSGYAEYQLAAYAGTFKHPELCIARYNTCRTPIQKLREIIKRN
jgi:hypothetical protein